MDKQNYLETYLTKALEDQKFTDIKFVVGKEPKVQTFDAHRLVVARASPDLDAVCSGRPAEGSAAVLVPDVAPEHFQATLHYIYYGRVDMKSAEHASGILRVAEKYSIHTLASTCVNYLVSRVSLENVWDVLRHCSGNQEASEKCAQQFRRLLSRSELLHAESKTILRILDWDPALVASEAELLRACVRWAEARCERDNVNPTKNNLQTKLGPALHKIRFLAMTAEELLKSDAFKRLLTYEQAFNVLANVVLPGSAPLPKNFSTERNQRTAFTCAVVEQKDDMTVVATNEQKPLP